MRAATAGALNACREHLAEDLAPTLGWRDVLFGHFRDKLGLVVEDDNGDAASWKVGRAHIKHVIESFPGMACKDLVATIKEARQPAVQLLEVAKREHEEHALLDRHDVAPPRPVREERVLAHKLARRAHQQRAAGPGRSSTRARPFAAARSRISVPATRAQLRASFIVMTAACTDAGWLF